MPFAWFTWDKPTFAHWIVPELALAVPDGLELDRWEGQPVFSLAAVGVVGPAPRMIVRSPLAPALSYAQVNLRTYVRGPAGPGLFILDTRVDRLMPLAARVLGAPYRFDRMAAIDSAPGRIDVHASGIDLDGSIGSDEPREALPGSFDAFVLERYVLYGRFAVRVSHRPWRVRALAVERASISGWERLGRVTAAHFAEPLEVETTGLSRYATSRRRSRWRTSPVPT
jgi:uncharacterized protein